MSMHWMPPRPEPRPTRPPDGTAVTVRAWCGCGRYVGEAVRIVPAAFTFWVDHGACLSEPVLQLSWTERVSVPWTPQHP